MNLLISSLLPLILLSLATGVGLNAGILLRKSHFSMPITNNLKDVYRWVSETYDQWKYEEFSRWYVQTDNIGIR